MKKIIALFCLSILLCACGKHFISDKTYREQVHNDFLQRQELAKGRSEALFGVFDQKLTTEEREALEFLYAYMPLSDLADYDGEFFLQQVRMSFKARESFAWGKKIPEDVFRHFVLVYRVNNENLDSARTVFFNELQPRLQGLSMYDAALEINHWCHEKVAYRPADGRTSSPLATVRTALGRCGEESTFTVTALRAVGIPARQCYTPRWAHTDDNHAWVEVWVDGKWYFLGACEPDPELNMGWFAVPSTRTMMVHSNAFGKYNGSEEVTHQGNLFSRINMLPNYALTKKIVVQVCNTDLQPIPNATVNFKLYNYSEYYTIASQTTNQNGMAFLTTGYGDLLIWATDSVHFGYSLMDVRKDNDIVVVMDKIADTNYVEMLDIVPPVGSSNIVTANEAKTAANQKRLQYEDSVRNAYMATFKTDADAASIKNENLTQEQIGIFLKKSEGNYAALEAFLNKFQKKENGLYLYEFLSSLSDKDLRDFDLNILEQHITFFNPDKANYPFDVYVKGIISPRIANEGLRDWRHFLKEKMTEELGQNPTPEQVQQWIINNINIDNEGNYYNCPISPRGVYELRWSDAHSRDIFFVAACRALNIPAYMDNATEQLFAYSNGKWAIFSFKKDQEAKPTGKLVLHYNQKEPEKPIYWTNFTIAKFENGDFVTFDYENDPRVEQFPISLDLEEGYYLLSTGNRYSDGTALSHLTFFNVVADRTTEFNLVIRPLETRTGNFGTIDPNFGIKINDTETTVGELYRDNYLLLCFIDPTREPTKHLLKDLADNAKALEEKNCNIVCAVAPDNNAPDFKFANWHLPEQSMLYEDVDNSWHQSIYKTNNWNYRTNLPEVLLINSDGKIVLRSEGYQIGTSSQILKCLQYE